MSNPWLQDKSRNTRKYYSLLSMPCGQPPYDSNGNSSEKNETNDFIDKNVVPKVNEEKPDEIIL